MTAVEALEQLQPVEARTIIEHLRRGSVPVEQVPYFTVGRERWLSIIDDDLAHYIAAGGTKVRFLNGDYGDGKTHFLSIIQHLAVQTGFAVSFVVLTREVPMQKFELVYREIASTAVHGIGDTGHSRSDRALVRHPATRTGRSHRTRPPVQRVWRPWPKPCAAWRAWT